MAVAVVAQPAWSAEPPVPPAPNATDEGQPPDARAAYRDLSASQSRNYDRTQDISVRQLLILLEVAERTAASMGLMLATGEHESARTWNNFVRPTLRNGSLGSATGVWQFQPATFHRIVRQFGAQLLTASAADAAAGRDRLDLAEGPFSDEQVRRIIQETIDGKRGAEDGDLQLLRHNFAVLAFTKHYLSVDTGATTPEEDYLFHFLGEGQGRRILALARGEARDTLCVKPVEAPVPALEPLPDLLAGDAAPSAMNAAAQPRPGIAAKAAVVTRMAPNLPTPPFSTTWGLQPTPMMDPGDRALAMMRAEAARQGLPTLAAELTEVLPMASLLPPPVSSQWGLPANSATVTGNLGMFYRDGKGQSQPYTWGGFMENLAKRVRAQDQPAMVRAKYGVGFDLKGGDLPEWAFNPAQISDPAEYRHQNGMAVLVPEALVTGPLDRDERRQYKQRLAALVSQGEDQSTDTLPPEARSALHGLRLLPANRPEGRTGHPEVQKALISFRKTVGKAEPDDPAQLSRLLPAERIALEFYGQRIARYAALQADQLAAFGTVPEVNRIKKLPPALQRSAAPHLAAVQTALAARGLLTPPTQKSVWRDKKRRKHVEYKTVPFSGKADKATIAALNSFQLRNGLRRTEGILDPVTLKMLGLPPMGSEILRPLSGPQCPFEGPLGTTQQMMRTMADNAWGDLIEFSPAEQRSVPLF